MYPKLKSPWTSECDLMWKLGLCIYDQVKRRQAGVGWACPSGGAPVRRGSMDTGTGMGTAE